YGGDRNGQDQPPRASDRSADHKNKHDDEWVEVDDAANDERDDEGVLHLAQGEVDKPDDDGERRVGPIEGRGRLQECDGYGNGAGGPGTDKGNQLKEPGCDGEGQGIVDVEDAQHNVGGSRHNDDEQSLTPQVCAE